MNIKLRKFPYPYKAMLAISSDIDSTTPENFEYIHDLIKHPRHQIELNFSDSIWMFASNAKSGKQLAFFDMGTEKLAPYWRKLKYYINKDWIDTLHTYGNFSQTEASNNFNRDYALKSFEFLDKHKLTFDVWVNHGDENNTQNLGAYSYMQGATPDDASYHYDICKKIGVKYIWNPKQRDIFGHSSMLSPLKLKNGENIWGFPRFHSYFVNADEKKYYEARGAIFWGKDKNEAVLWHPSLLDLQLTTERLESLFVNQQYAIVTQHFGNIKDTNNKFTPEAIAALKKLSDYSKSKINVVSTSKLLNYNRVNEFLEYEVIRLEKGCIINITSINDPVLGKSVDLIIKELEGVTFYTDDPFNTFFMLNGKIVRPEYTKRNVSDGIAQSITISTGTMNIESDISARYEVVNEFNNQNKPAKVTGASSDESLTKKASVSLWERAIAKAMNFNKNKKKPDFSLLPVICIGGMKCGTSTLWDMLSQHPEVLPCSVKEPSYFAVRDLNLLSKNEYYSLWPWDKFTKKNKVIFEASTHYSKFPASNTAATQIKAIAPNAKIIYLVRDPIKRLESQLAHHISRGELSSDLLADNRWKENTHLFNLSLYNQRIDPYVEQLGKNNILVISLEELIADHKNTLQKIEDFLCISTFDRYTPLKKSNPRRMVLGADKVTFNKSDQSYIFRLLESDINQFIKRFSLDNNLWKTWNEHIQNM
ncbi:hypothetical protein CW745_03660 [Psychromonas sp. psych-6C06]|uniref:sulfotransferase family protein n=1 Tax=Psychromonas sp. psych-6C06 TaxID=2058089 RepID=UPI000C342A4B|nr:sulfotransferase [Psychromonas sp. psych-6C06]PKF62534.1 hypothetical protein CW745_03660 [Psychromonas sp. psych-6C06]